MTRELPPAFALSLCAISWSAVRAQLQTVALWPMFRGKARHTGASQYMGAQSATVK